jgi:hypothetical protein
LSRSVTWLNKLSEDISEEVPKIGMLQLQSTKLVDEINEIEFEKFDNRNVLKERNKEQVVHVQETQIEEIGEVDNEDKEEYQIQTRSSVKASGKLPRELRNLDTFYNHILYTQEEQHNSLLLSVGTRADDPENFEDAWDHPNPDERKG